MNQIQKITFHYSIVISYDIRIHIHSKIQYFEKNSEFFKSNGRIYIIKQIVLLDRTYVKCKKNVKTINFESNYKRYYLFVKSESILFYYYCVCFITGKQPNFKQFHIHFKFLTMECFLIRRHSKSIFPIAIIKTNDNEPK